MPTAEAIVSALRDEFARNADAEDAAYMKSYMRDQFDFFGIKSPLRRQLLRSFLTKHDLPPLAKLKPLVQRLWQQPEREMQHSAMELLQRRAKELAAGDLPLLENMITNKSWWDTVDFIAYKLVGQLLARHPEDEPTVARRYSASGNLWLIRVSILFQLLRKERTNRELLAEMIGAHRSHPDFFIRKAIGWALRDYAKANPEWVIQFVRDTKLSPLSQREAMKNLRTTSGG